MMRHVWHVLYLLPVLFALPAWAGGLPTQDEALARGREFARAVGWVSPQETIDAFLMPPDLELNWGVKLVRHASSGDEGMPLYLDRASGQVVRAANNSLLKHQRATAVAPLTARQAEAAAAKVLATAGQPLDQWKRDGLTLARHAGGQTWNVAFRRVYAGYPFEYDRIVMTLAPTGGTLLTLAWLNRSPTPEATTPAVTREQAVAAARARLAAQQFTVTRLASARAMFVKVKDYSANAKPARTRLAWVVRGVERRTIFYGPVFRHVIGEKRPRRDPRHPKEGRQEEIAEVWVDAGDGTILGDFRYHGATWWLRQ